MKNILMVTLAMGLFAFHSAFADSDDLSAYAELISARADYQRMLTEAKLADAEIQLKEAETRLKNAEADRLRHLIDVLVHEFSRIKFEEQAINQKILDIQLKAGLIAGLRVGETDKAVFIGLDYFFRVIIPISILKKTMFKEVDALTKDNFVANDEKSLLKDFPGGNLGQLLKFVRQNNYSFTEWSEGHSAILDMMAGLAKAADDKIGQYHRYMDELRAGTLNIWQAPSE